MQILKWDSLKILSQTFVRSNTSFLFTYLLHHSIPREDRLFPKERGTYYLGEEGGAVTCLQSLPWEPVSFTCCSRKREKVSPGIPRSWPPEEGHTTQNGHRLEGTFENPFKVKLVGLSPSSWAPMECGDLTYKQHLGSKESEEAGTQQLMGNN
jgi:hypothetical protein